MPLPHPTSPDDTIVDQPDTPAPVFAARAFKRAIFGTPAPPKEAASKKSAPEKMTNADAKKPENKVAKPAYLDAKSYESPTKPQGILLTPGTGTSRRKRVSFGRDVKSNASLLSDSDGANRTRPRTKLQEALENSRKRRDNRHSEEDDAKKLDFDPMEDKDGGDDVWEEIDDADRDTDNTVDLNEPRSQSGRYWKGEFQKYHDEARAEMEKLVKYKQLAKSYAQAKDAEALDLNERLREEQAKVVEMEQRIAELAGQIGAKQGRDGSTQDDRRLMKDLTRQTALAVQYRSQVEQLEALLKDSGYEAGESSRRRGGTSPPTGRGQARELSELRQELQRAKSDLSAAERRELKLEAEKKELERKLSRKDAQYDKLKADYDALKDKNKAQRDEMADLKRSHRIPKSGDAGLLKEDLKSLSTGHGASSPWEEKFDDLQSKLKDEQEARRREMEDASVTISQLRQEFKRASEFKSHAQRKASVNRRTKFDQTSKFGDDDDTHDLLKPQPFSVRKQTETPHGRPISRGSKRTVSGKILGRQSVPTERSTYTPRSVDLARLSSKSRLGLVTERALDSESDPEAKPNSVPSRNVPSRSALSTDRRAAAIARLEQKRAERKMARERATIPGKENVRP